MAQISGRAGAAFVAGLVLFSWASLASGQGIAAKYTRDVGIQNDPDVIMTEMFEDSISAISARWTQVANGGGMSLIADVPPGSAGTRSLQMTSVGGTNTGGHLYKNLVTGHDQLYLRYYIKYASGQNTYHHAGGWFGGQNPASNFLFPQCCAKPTGTDKFYVGPELKQPNFDLYTGWMEMRPSPDNVNYFGNTFVPTSVTLSRDQWHCVEVMMKMNDPTSGRSGELALWLNGTQIIHLREGAPNGDWSGNRFNVNPASPNTFEGFRWRSTPELNVNFLWLNYYTTLNPSGFVGNLKWDHVVLAKKYIGPLSTSPAGDPPPAAPSGLRVP